MAICIVLLYWPREHCWERWLEMGRLHVKYILLIDSQGFQNFLFAFGTHSSLQVGPGGSFFQGCKGWEAAGGILSQHNYTLGSSSLSVGHEAQTLLSSAAVQNLPLLTQECRGNSAGDVIRLWVISGSWKKYEIKLHLKTSFCFQVTIQADNAAASKALLVFHC